MIFFTDRDLGSLFPQILSNAGLHVEKHDDHFPDRKTPDASWLSEVGRNGWFALSRDKRIRYRPNEQEATMRAGVGLFIIVGQASHQKLAEHFVACVPKITRFLRKHQPPFIAKIYMPSPWPETSEPSQDGTRRNVALASRVVESRALKRENDYRLPRNFRLYSSSNHPTVPLTGGDGQTR